MGLLRSDRMAPSMQIGTQFLQIFEDNAQTQRRSSIKLNTNASVVMTSGDINTSIRISNIAHSARVLQRRAVHQGGGRKTFLIPGGIFFFGGDPPRGGGGYEKKWVLQKKLFLPMSHLPHIITVFPRHKLPLLLVGISLFGSLGY